MALGMGGAFLVLPPGTPFLVILFIGACLCATSISISAKILTEKGAGQYAESRVIVGAAVLDDVLGLLVLTGVTGAVAAAATGGVMAWGGLVRELLLAVGFLVAAVAAGRRFTPTWFRLANQFRSQQVLLPSALGLALVLAWLGYLAGLAVIVGAYAAGLILEPAHVRTLEQRELHRLKELVQPLVAVFSPLFFVLMGARIETRAFLSGRTLLLAVVLGGLGILGKVLAGCTAGSGLRSSLVGWGMVPRGEVGLIFVATGSQLTLDGHRLLAPDLQAAIILALVLTTLAGPVGLEHSLRRRKTAGQPGEARSRSAPVA
jgi:Kef-type K+ transport system membrane component KefB